VLQVDHVGLERLALHLLGGAVVVIGRSQIARGQRDLRVTRLRIRIGEPNTGPFWRMSTQPRANAAGVAASMHATTVQAATAGILKGPPGSGASAARKVLRIYRQRIGPAITGIGYAR
jgi:hypothetical protein